MARYTSVNGAWPDGDIPTPTAAEAASAAKRLYRLVMKKPFRGKIRIVSGNRHTWITSGEMTVNPDKKSFGSEGGWHSLVHDLSHYCHRRLFPRHRPHDGFGQHAFIERSMITHVVDSGWLEGKLVRPKKEKAAPNLKAIRHERVLKRIENWERKRKRAETALRKLRRTSNYYERELSRPS